MAERTEIAQFLTLAGDGTGPNEFVGNYAGAPVYPQISAQNPLGSVAVRTTGLTRLFLQTLSIFIGDVGGDDDFTHERYGSIPELPNGVAIEIRGTGDVLLRNLTAGDAVTTNGGWMSITQNQELQRHIGGGNGPIGGAYTYDFGKAIKSGGIIIDIDEGEYLRVTMQDNFGALTNHRFFVTGTVGGQTVGN